MNFLSELYSDGYYRAFLNTAPLASICCVDGEFSRGVAAILSTNNRFAVDIITQFVEYSDVSPNPDFCIESNWCFRHQERYSCVVFPVSWNFLQKYGASSYQCGDKWLNEFRTNTGAKVVIVCVVESATPARGLLMNYEAVWRERLGDSYGGVECVSLATAKLDRCHADELLKCVGGVSQKFYQNSIDKLAAEKCLMSVPTFQAVGICFKIGWLHLVLRNYDGAVSVFDDALDIAQQLAAFPPFQLRLSACILLRFVLQLFPLCSSDSTVVPLENAMRVVQWIGRAYPSENSKMNRILLCSVTRVAVTECLEMIARKMPALPSTKRCSILMSAAYLLEEILPLCRDSDLSVAVKAPQWLGTEFDGCHPNMGRKFVQRKWVEEKIRKYVLEGSSGELTRMSECLYFSSVTNSKGTGEDFDGSACHRLRNAKKSMMEIPMRMQYNRTSDKYSLISGCANSTCPLNQIECMKLLRQMPPQNWSLEYPRGSFLAPFSVIASFRVPRARQRESVEAILTMSSLCNENLVVSNLSLDIVNRDANSSCSVSVIPEELNIVPLESRSISIITSFSQFGSYYCSKIAGRVIIGNISLDILWNFGLPDDMPRPLPPGFCVYGLQYFNLDIQNTDDLIEINLPSSVSAVEGERVNLFITLRSKTTTVHEGEISFLHLPNKYAIEKAMENELSDPLLQDGCQTFRVSGIVAGESQRFSFSLCGVRGGLFDIPVTLHIFGGEASFKVERVIKAEICPPFEICFSIIRFCEAYTQKERLLVPSSQKCHTVTERNILVKSSYNTTLDHENDYYQYFAVEERSNSEDQAVCVGDVLTILSAIRCTAKNGLSLRKAEVICGDGIELLYTSLGEFPCLLEQDETATVATRLRILSSDWSIPGVLRILFQPNSSNRLVSDICFPHFVVKEPPTSISLEHSSLAVVGSVFQVTLIIRNLSIVNLTGEVRIESSQDYRIDGKQIWMQSIGSKSEVRAQIVLTLLRVGTIRLPLCTFSGVDFSAGTDERFVRVAPVLLD